MYICYLFDSSSTRHFWTKFLFTWKLALWLRLGLSFLLSSFCLFFLSKLKGKSWPRDQKDNMRTTFGISSDSSHQRTSLLSWLTHMYPDSCTMTCKAAGTWCNLFAVQITALPKKVRGWATIFDNGAQRPHAKSEHMWQANRGPPVWSHARLDTYHSVWAKADPLWLQSLWASPALGGTEIITRNEREIKRDPSILHIC